MYAHCACALACPPQPPQARTNLASPTTPLPPPAAVMRIRGSRLQQEMLDTADGEWVEGRGPGLSRVYDALNSLGATPWAINQDVFRVVETGERGEGGRDADWGWVRGGCVPIGGGWRGREGCRFETAKGREGGRDA